MIIMIMMMMIMLMNMIIVMMMFMMTTLMMIKYVMYDDHLDNLNPGLDHDGRSWPHSNLLGLGLRDFHNIGTVPNTGIFFLTNPPLLHGCFRTIFFLQVMH